MAATMNSWQLVEFGRSNLHLEQVSVPVAGPGEVLIKVHAASLNYRDMQMIEDGMGMPLDGPFTPASDMAGTVAVIGRGVVQFKPGDRVISAFFNTWVDGVAPQPIISLGGPGPGPLSAYVVLNEKALVRAPAPLTPAPASTLTCAGPTPVFALAQAGSGAGRGRGLVTLKPGDGVTSAFFTNCVDGVAPQPIISLGGPGPGPLSEYVVLNENALVRAPVSLTPAQASTLTCAVLTAWFALAEAGSTRVGDVVVVQGTGGVALFAVQLAHAQGAKAIVISGSDEKIEQVKALGAWKDTLRGHTPDWADAVRRLTAGRGADHVLER